MAGIEISALPAVGTALGSDYFPVVQGGVTKRETADQLISKNNSIIGLASTSSSSVGVINQNGNSFIHTFGTGNTFVGVSSGNFTLSSSSRNTAVGSGALDDITTNANDNTCIGWTSASITTGSQNTFVGSAIAGVTTGSGNNFFGFATGANYTSSESDNILIQNAGVLGESNICRIGTEGTGAGQITDMYLAGTVHASQIATAGITGTSTLSFTRNSIASSYTNTFSNTDNTDPASALVLQLTTGGASGGDPYILYQVTGVTSWTTGIDNSDSDTWKISNSTAPGTNDYFSVTTGQTINLNAGQVVKVRTVTAASDTAAATDYFLACNRSGAIALALMASPETGRTFRVKDISGSASVNNITITPAAGNIDGAATYVINTNHGEVGFIYTGSEWSVF